MEEDDDDDDDDDDKQKHIFFCRYDIFAEGVFLTQLSSNAGISI